VENWLKEFFVFLFVDWIGLCCVLGLNRKVFHTFFIELSKVLGFSILGLFVVFFHLVD
jgi:hypothetical protein